MHTKKLMKNQIERKKFRNMDQISSPNEAHGRNFCLNGQLEVSEIHRKTIFEKDYSEQT